MIADKLPKFPEGFSEPLSVTDAQFVEVNDFLEKLEKQDGIHGLTISSIDSHSNDPQTAARFVDLLIDMLVPPSFEVLPRTYITIRTNPVGVGVSQIDYGGRKAQWHAEPVSSTASNRKGLGTEYLVRRNPDGIYALQTQKDLTRIPKRRRSERPSDVLNLMTDEEILEHEYGFEIWEHIPDYALTQKGAIHRAKMNNGDVEVSGIFCRLQGLEAVGKCAVTNVTID